MTELTSSPLVFIDFQSAPRRTFSVGPKFAAIQNEGAPAERPTFATEDNATVGVIKGLL